MQFWGRFLWFVSLPSPQWRYSVIALVGWWVGGFLSSLGSFINNVQTHKLQFCCEIADFYNHVEFVFAGIGADY